MATKSASAIANPPAAAPQGDAASLAGAAQDVHKTARAEADAIRDAVANAIKLATQAKPLARSFLAQDHGKTVNKTGRPEVNAWLASIVSLLGNDMTVNAFDRHCREIVNAIGTGELKLSEAELKDAKAKAITGKGRSKFGSMSYTLKITPPTAWAVKME